MKITKYDVHVHPIKNQKLGSQIIGKYYYMTNDDFNTLKRALAMSDDETFKQYFNNPKYVIHMVYDQVLEQWEKDAFMDAIRNDADPCNFFMTRRKCCQE